MGLQHFTAGIPTLVCIQGSQYVQPWEHEHKVKRKGMLAKSKFESTKNRWKQNMILNLPVLFDSNRGWLMLHYRIIVLMCISSVCQPGIPCWRGVAIVAVSIHRLIFYSRNSWLFLFRLLVGIARGDTIIVWSWNLYWLRLEVLYGGFGFGCCIVCIVPITESVRNMIYWTCFRMG